MCLLRGSNGSTCQGSAAVIIPPLLFGSTAGGSLRTEWRKLEDKLSMHRVEVRPFVINLDCSSLHGNRECPMAYIAWVGVADSTLGSKGTAHRALRGKDAEPTPPRVNSFPDVSLETRLLFVLWDFLTGLLCIPYHHVPASGSVPVTSGADKGFYRQIFLRPLERSPLSCLVMGSHPTMADAT